MENDWNSVTIILNLTNSSILCCGVICFGQKQTYFALSCSRRAFSCICGEAGRCCCSCCVLGWDPLGPVNGALACPLITFIITGWSWCEKVQQLTIVFSGFILLPLSKVKNQQLLELLSFCVSHHCDDGSSPETPAQIALFPPFYLLLSFVPPSLPIPD